MDSAIESTKRLPGCHVERITQYMCHMAYVGTKEVKCHPLVRHFAVCDNVPAVEITQLCQLETTFPE